MENRFYVYVLLDPRKPGKFEYGLGESMVVFSHEPFYVGKGSGNRVLIHYSQNKKGENKYKTNIVNKLKRLGFTPCYVKYYQSLPEQTAFDCEKELIQTIGRREKSQGPLVNNNDGGTGSSGAILSEEHKAKLRQWHTGKIVKEETKEKLRQITGDKTSMYGVVRPVEWVQYIKVKNIKYRFLVKCPNGDVITVYNITDFARSVGISNSHLYQTWSGKRTHTGGYCIVDKVELPTNWTESSYYTEYLECGGVDACLLFKEAA